jgi:hypothetical protein
MQFADLVCPSSLSTLISSWLAEDVPSWDVGGYVVGASQTAAHLYMKVGGGVVEVLTTHCVL